MLQGGWQQGSRRRAGGRLACAPRPLRPCLERLLRRPSPPRARDRLQPASSRLPACLSACVLDGVVSVTLFSQDFTDECVGGIRSPDVAWPASFWTMGDRCLWPPRWRGDGDATAAARRPGSSSSNDLASTAAGHLHRLQCHHCGQHGHCATREFECGRDGRVGAQALYLTVAGCCSETDWCLVQCSAV